jgi:hypothetical protein
MTGFGAISPQAYMLQKVLPQRGANIYRSGITEGEKGYEIYASPSSTNPTLIISSPLYDDDRNVIMPGYYELILSGDRTMLSLTQAGQNVAVIPVFKIEEDKMQDETPPPMDSKAQKKFDKEQKKKEKKHKQQVRKGEIPDGVQQIYTNATIEYDEKDDYYLIKYERGKIRAWGAVK